MLPAANIGLRHRVARQARRRAAATRPLRLAAVVGVGLVLRLTVAFGPLRHLPLVSDAAGYAGQAAGMARGDPVPAYYWPPGTSYVIAGFYDVLGVHPWVAKLSAILVDAANVGLVAALAARLVADRRAPLVAGVLYAVFPSAVLMAAQPFSLQLTLLFLLLLAILLLDGARRHSWLRLAGAGAAFGCAVLTRPSTATLLVSLVALLVVLLLRVHRRASPIPGRTLAFGVPSFAAAAVLVVLPALEHNHALGQGWTVSTANEQNLWFGNNPYTPNYKTWYLGQHDPSHFPRHVATYLRSFGAGHPPTRRQRSEMLTETKRFVLAHPGVTLLRTVNRVRAFWGFDYTMTVNIRDTLRTGSAATAALFVLEVGGYLLVMVLFLVGVLFARARARAGAVAFAALLIGGFQLAYAFAYAAGRWHFPMLGLLMPFAALGAVWLASAPRRVAIVRRSASFWTALAVLGAVQVEYAYFVWSVG